MAEPCPRGSSAIAANTPDAWVVADECPDACPSGVLISTEIPRSRDEPLPRRRAPRKELFQSRQALTKLHPPGLDDTVDISIAMSNDISRDISEAV
jgi:hypothetical protein